MVRRNAIIISCPDRNGNFLPGAVNDPQSMQNFLLSPKGGCWKQHEIYVFKDAKWAAVKKFIQQTAADYQLIYFTGHGCTDENSQRVLQFEDFLIPDTALLNNNPRQLIIVDSCRVYLPVISGISPAEDVYSSFTGESVSRLIFDNCIKNSPSGKLIVHATEDGKLAKEALHGIGGVFTISLLVTALKYITENEFTPVSIQELLPEVTKTIHALGYEQKPGVVYKEGWLEVPFMIDIDQVLNEEPTLKNISSKTISALLGIAATIIAINYLRNN